MAASQLAGGQAALEEAPIILSPLGFTLPFESGPSEEDVTRMISENAYSFRVSNIPGVIRYDGSQSAAKSPCEQRFVHGKFPSPYNDGTDWIVWGIFDGLDGWQTADMLGKYIIPSIQRNILKAPAVTATHLSDRVIRTAIQKGFTDLDDAIILPARQIVESEEPLQHKIKKLVPCHSGSCALVSIYIPDGRLFVACTGDSKAVLGVRVIPGAIWKVEHLSKDQTTQNESEVTRFEDEHPGERYIIYNNMLPGGRVTRAFGSAKWKWPMDLQIEVANKLRGRLPLPAGLDYLTPPYVTAKPVIVKNTVDSSKPAFLIMATISFWRMVSDQNAVNLVVEWWNAQKAGTGDSGQTTAYYEPFHFGRFGDGMPEWFVKPRLTIQDDNAAVHLIRNALGGNHHELIASRLAFTPPLAENVRNDMTVQVVFFNTDV
ncbi:pyruvate dehydrogenase [Nemania abortiva]|nr:pyruvate dehydrogenase [Nemania abortiva]